MNTITDKTYKALSILSSASWDRPMSAYVLTDKGKQAIKEYEQNN